MNSIIIELIKAEFFSECETIEAVIDQTPEIDRWCSSPDWVMAVHAGFSVDDTPLFLTTPDRSGYAALTRFQDGEGRTVIAGLELAWGFAAPFVAKDPATFFAAMATYLAQDATWDDLILTGLPYATHPNSYVGHLRKAFLVLGDARMIEGIDRQIVHLGDSEDRFEKWFARRSSSFRRNSRRCERKASAHGIKIEDVSQSNTNFERILQIEKQSWKGPDDEGITAPEMHAVYRYLTKQLATKGRLCLHIAVHEGRDCGYILGGLRNGIYRGLQLSYIEEMRDFSIGHLLQLHQLRELSGSDKSKQANRYDMGMDIAYKRRWADKKEKTLILGVTRG